MCGSPVGGAAKKKPALDHDHTTGFIRGVLCINCNGIEGKVFNLARRAKAGITERDWLHNLWVYWNTHSIPQYGGVYHPTHKTPEEKRLERNAKAKKRRLAKK